MTQALSPIESCFGKVEMCTVLESVEAEVRLGEKGVVGRGGVAVPLRSIEVVHRRVE